MSLGILSQLGHALVSLGLGGAGDAESDTAPGSIVIYAAEPLCRIEIEAVEPLCEIRIESMSNLHHIGDVVRLRFETLSSSGVRRDPATLTVRVRRSTPSLGQTIQLVYGIAPSVEGSDALIRLSEGHYEAHVAMTPARGAGDYDCSIIATGAVIAGEPSSFRVFPLPV